MTRTTFRKGDLFESFFYGPQAIFYRRIMLLRPKYANHGLIKMWVVWDLTNNKRDIVHYESLTQSWIIVERATRQPREKKVLADPGLSAKPQKEPKP